MALFGRREFFRSAALAGCGGGLALLGRAQDAAPNEDFVSKDAQTAIENSLEFLGKAQAADGSYGDRNGSGNVAVSALAGLAFLAAGHQPGRGRYGRNVARITDYLVARGRAGKSGYLQNADPFLSHSAMYQHGFGALFLSEVHGTFPDPERQAKVRDMLEKAILLTVKSQNREGGWRYEPQPANADVSVTVAQLMALRAAKNAGIYVDKAAVDKCVDYIKGCRMADGGFCYMKDQRQTGSQFPRSAAAVVGLYSAGIYEGEYIEKGLKYLMRYLPVGAKNQFDMRQDHYFYGHYYAALAMWTAGGNFWAEWFPAIRNELLAKRNNQGVWDDFYGNSYATSMAAIILQLPNNYLPIMQK